MGIEICMGYILHQVQKRGHIVPGTQLQVKIAGGRGLLDSILVLTCCVRMFFTLINQTVKRYSNISLLIDT